MHQCFNRGRVGRRRNSTNTAKNSKRGRPPSVKGLQTPEHRLPKRLKSTTKECTSRKNNGHKKAHVILND